jgi:aryl carrier-like protein
MTLGDFETAIRPKVHGSWNLHKHLPSVQFFILLSSLMGVMGGASQANYAAGGAFQDALAAHRISRGLPAVTIDLGMVKAVGYVAQTDGVSNRLARIGLESIHEEDVLRILELSIQSSTSSQIITGINTGPGMHWEEAEWLQDERFIGLKYRETTQSATKTPTNNIGENLRDKLAHISSLAEAKDLIVRKIIKKLTIMFGLSEEEVSPTKDLATYGVDSLIAVELRNWIASQAGADISIFDLMQSPSLTELSVMVASKSSQIDSALLQA